MSSQNKPMLMSLADFAAHLSISLSTLRRRVDEGIIPVLHEGKRVSVPVAAAEKRYMEYLIGKEREYRVGRASATKAEAASPAPATFADKGWDIAQRIGLDLRFDTGARETGDGGEGRDA